MNAKVSVAPHKISCSLWICAVLDWFAKCHLQQPSQLFSHSNYDQQFADQLGVSLTGLPQKLLQADYSQLDIPPSLMRLLSSGRISHQELFVACFCAELNNNYWLNLAVQEMQGTQADAWPRSYFLCDLLNGFNDTTTTPADMLQWSLVKTGVLVINTQGPLVLSHVQLDLQRWRWFTQVIYADELIQYKAISAAQKKNTAAKSLVIHQLENTENSSALDEFSLALRLQQLSCLHLCASVYAGRAFSFGLAARLNLELVVPAAPALQQPLFFDLLCVAHDWLPLVDFSAVADTAQQKVTLVRGIVLHKEPITNDVLEIIKNQTAASVYWLPHKPHSERVAAWQQWFDVRTAESFANRWLCNSEAIQSFMARVAPGMEYQSRTVVEQVAIEQAIKTARLQTAPASLQNLAFHVPWHLGAGEIVFNPKLTAELKSLQERCLQRQSLCNGLGNPLTATHNTGVRALLYGESGTGKTLSAIYLASQLGAPLYRLDLGAVLNKYVGETEKNIHLLLAQAAEDDFILLIDEADALFAKRSDGESGGERFANMLTNYLLARIEQHPGIVLMTTNGLGRIDTAFMRRFDRVVEFQTPQLEERASIWLQHLGTRSPGEDYCRQLASLCDLSGGFIRNAVLAAAAEVPAARQLTLPYGILLKTIAQEYRKSGKPIPPKLLTQLNLQSSVPPEPTTNANFRAELSL